MRKSVVICLYAAVLSVLSALAFGQNWGFDNVSLYKASLITKNYDLSGSFSDTGADDADEVTAGPYGLGFNFTFYGQTYSQLKVTSNGFFSFNTGISGNPYNGRLTSGSGARLLYDELLSGSVRVVRKVFGFAGFGVRGLGQFRGFLFLLFGQCPGHRANLGARCGRHDANALCVASDCTEVAD